MDNFFKEYIKRQKYTITSLTGLIEFKEKIEKLFNVNKYFFDIDTFKKELKKYNSGIIDCDLIIESHDSIEKFNILVEKKGISDIFMDLSDNDLDNNITKKVLKEPI